MGRVVSLGRDSAEDFLTAWLIEKSLSIDNLFVFLVIFDRLRIPTSEQHRVLFWGILGAFVTRALFIASGSALLSAWHGAVYVLGRVPDLHGRQDDERPRTKGEGKILSFVRRHLPLHSTQGTGIGSSSSRTGAALATPLMLALIVIEITDMLFAIDSIPAVFSVTSEPFIVYSSNVFAILGMRALYLVLADLLSGLKYLRYGLSAILVLAGAKMLASRFIHIPHAYVAPGHRRRPHGRDRPERGVAAARSRSGPGDRPENRRTATGTRR